jgi:hypothetical protein
MKMEVRMLTQNEYLADKLYEQRRDDILRQSLEDQMLRREGLLKPGILGELRNRSAAWLGRMLVSVGRRLESAGASKSALDTRPNPFRPNGLSIH